MSCSIVFCWTQPSLAIVAALLLSQATVQEGKCGTVEVLGPLHSQRLPDLVRMAALEYSILKLMTQELYTDIKHREEIHLELRSKRLPRLHLACRRLYHLALFCPVL